MASEPFKEQQDRNHRNPATRKQKKVPGVLLSFGDVLLFAAEEDLYLLPLQILLLFERLRIGLGRNLPRPGFLNAAEQTEKGTLLVAGFRHA